MASLNQLLETFAVSRAQSAIESSLISSSSYDLGICDFEFLQEVRKISKLIVLRVPFANMLYVFLEILFQAFRQSFVNVVDEKVF